MSYRRRIDAAIREVAARGVTFSANDLRDLVPDARGGVVGARFNALSVAGVIEQVGMERSNKVNTHAHRILTWRAVA